MTITTRVALCAGAYVARPRHQSVALYFALSVLLLATSSCSRDETGGDPAWAGERQPLPTGGVLVTNPAAGLWSNDPPWTIEEDLRIGAADGDAGDPDVFGQIVAIAMDEDGRIFAFDGQARELRVFGNDGGLLRRFGRQGGGPGEFESVIGMSLAPQPEGSIWIVDPANTRYTIVAGDGSQRSFRRGVGAMYRLPWLGGFTAPGDFVDAVTIPGPPRVTDALVRVDSVGATSDTIPLPNPALDVPRMGQMEFPLPFAPRVLRAFDRRGYAWTAMSGEYRLVQTSMAGDTVMIVEREADPPQLTGEQRDSLRQYTQTLTTDLGIRVPDGMLPRTAPVLRWLTVDDRGFVWVCRATAESCASLDVFDDTGRFLGEVAMPFPIRGGVTPVVRGDRLLAVTEDELGVPMLVRARINGR